MPTTYSEDEKREIVNSIEKSLKESSITVKEACSAHDISDSSYYNWRERLERKKETKPDSKLEKTEKLVVNMKKEHPYYGQKKISMQLKRFHGLKVKRSRVAKILKKHGLLETSCPNSGSKKGKRRFERIDKNELWQMDLMHYQIKDAGKFYLISALDDYSRFICAHKVCTTKKAEKVIDTFKMAVEEHGLPQQILTDRGTQFHSWKGITRFEKTLDRLGVKHILASPQSPQTIGKIESWHRNIQRELLRQKEFESIEGARDAIADYVKHYNYERTHMGIDYLTPADRYFGVENDVKKEMESDNNSSERIYLTARIDGQPIRAQEKEKGKISVKLAGSQIKTIKADKLKSILL